MSSARLLYPDSHLYSEQTYEVDIVDVNDVSRRPLRKHNIEVDSMSEANSEAGINSTTHC